MLAVAASSPGAEPRWATPRSPERPTFGHAISAVSQRIGQPFMPWQEQVALVGGEMVEHEATGLLIPAYRLVVVTIHRQGGKTTLVLAWECQRASGWEHLGPQRIAYSAQTGADARKKLINDQKPSLDRHQRALGIKRIYEAIGAEGVVWVNGSRLTLLNNTAAGGHGQTIDLGIKDELFADYDDRRDQALVPAMATRAAGQVLACSTMGTEESLPLNALVDKGRLAVDTDARSGIAYFEWSAPDDDDPDDPATWRRCMPALGYTITEDVVCHARQTLRDGEFRRAFLNQRTKADDRVLPQREWDAACSDTASPDPVRTMVIDINPERSAGAIVAAAPGVAELVEHREGTGWLLDRAVVLNTAHGRPLWVVDSTGPAASLVPALEAAGLRVHAASGRDLINACGQFYDGVMERTIAIRRHPKLDAAAAGAGKRTVGDAWAWTRKGAADICPLVGVTLALWAAGQAVEQPAPFFIST